MAWSYVSAGTVSSSGTPGQPASKASNDLLILVSICRAINEPANAAPTGYTVIDNSRGDNGLLIFGRWATNDSNDDVNHDFFDGSSSHYEQILCFRGGTYSDLATIVHASGTSQTTNNNITSPACTITLDDCLVVGVGKKAKTVTSDGGSCTSPTGLNNRVTFRWSNGSVAGLVIDYTIQTTATSISAGIWDVTNENMSGAGVIIALKSAGAATISSPTPSGTLGTTTTATLGCTTDTSSGTLYCVVDTASLSGIDATDIQGGFLPNGSTPAIWSGTTTVSTSSPTKAVTGLNPATTYNYALVQNTGIASNVLTGSFTTASGSTAFSAVYAGTASTTQTATPGIPTSGSKAINDLLLVVSQNRNSGEIFNSPPSGWTTLRSIGRIGVIGKYAQDTLTTSSSLDYISHDFWSENSGTRAVMILIKGGGGVALSEILAAYADSTNASGNDIPNALLTVPKDACLILGFACKTKSTTSDGASVSSPSGLSNRLYTSWASGNQLATIIDYTIQTTKANISASIWNQTVEESGNRASLLLALSSGTLAAAVLSSPTPSGTLGTTTTATTGATSTEDTGTVYAVVHTASLSGITAADVVAGKIADHTTSAAFSGNTSVSSTALSVPFAGLSAATLYYYALAQVTTAGNSNAVTGTFTTAALTAATISAVSADPTTGGFDIDFTITGANGTFSGVAVIADTGTPTAAQIHAGLNSSGTPSLASDATAATANVADTLSLTGIDYPIVDLHFAVGTAVDVLADQVKTPPTGYQYKTLTITGGLPAGSELDTSAATNDIVELSSTCSPDGAGIVMDVEGEVYLSAPVVGRQSLLFRQYDKSAGTWVTVTGNPSGTRALWYLNNEAPDEITPIPDQVWYTNVAITPVRLDDVYVSDGENDVLVYTPDVALPTGISIQERSDEFGPYSQIEGTPTATYNDDVTITVTDAALDQTILTTFNITVGTGVQVPDVEANNTVLQDAIDDIEAAGLIVSNITIVNNDVVDPGEVESTDPVGLTWVDPGTNVDIVTEGAIVPNVVNATQSSATTTLEAAGFVVSVASAFSFSTAVGKVIEQSPEAGDIALHGSTVGIIVSIGPPLFNSGLNTGFSKFGHLG